MRNWIFSAKTFSAAMLALYIAFYFDLPRPYWAMATVYIVSNPFVGATRSKALYRAIGTALGAVAAVILVPVLIDTPLLLSAAVALWFAAFLYLAISTRAARAYVFMLASYTLPIVAFSAVDDPGAVFDIAVSRVEEILLGITCSSVIGSVVFPNRLAPTVGDRNEAWFATARHFVARTLHGDQLDPTLAAGRRSMALHIRGMETLLSQLAYDHVSPQTLRYAMALQGRMQLLMPLASSLGDSLQGLRQAIRRDADADTDADTNSVGPSASGDEVAFERDPLERVHPALPALLQSFEAWFGQPVSYREESRRGDTGNDPAVLALLATIARLEPPVDIDTDAASAGQDYAWNDALLSLALWRLRNLIEIWQDCKRLQTVIHFGEGTWHPRYRHVQVGTQKHYLDHAGALFSALSAATVVFASTCIWIFTGWADGASAVSLGAVGLGLFVASDQPASMIMTYFTSACGALLLAAAYYFVILPSVHDFAMLVMFFALVFIPLGLFMTRPKVALTTTLIAFMTALTLGINDSYSNNVAVFFDSNIASCAGILFASLAIAVMRPFGARFMSARLIQASWRDIARRGAPIDLRAQRHFHGRLLDRLVQLIPRTAEGRAGAQEEVDALRDMRIGLNAVALRRRALRHEGALRRNLHQIVDSVGAHFQRRLDRGERAPDDLRLSTLIEITVTRVVHSAVLTSKQRIDIVHSLVGLHLSLFPDAHARPATAPAAVARSTDARTD